VKIGVRKASTVATLVTTVLSSTATAQESSVSPESAITDAASSPPEAKADGSGRPTANCACTDENNGARLHDGFFARSGTGLAFYLADVSAPFSPARRTAIRGYGQSADISIGGTPLAGFVIGGALSTAIIDPVFVENGVTVSPDDDSVKLRLVRVGPFVDWYPDPARGLHLQGALSFVAQVETDTKGNAVEPASIGGALSIASGYEWFIVDEVSVGFLARVTAGNFVRAAPEGDETMLWMVPELAISATYQ
jgi:hypothetical protein